MYLVECPHCGDKYHLKNVEKYAGKRVRFKCKAPSCLRSYEHKVVAQQRTQTGTVLIRSDKDTIAKTAWLTCNGLDGVVNCKVGKGKYVVGRKASKSSADVKIPVRDINMSRHHCQIVGIEQNGGLLFTIQDLDSVNGVYINDVRLDGGEVVFLSTGDIITLGQTKLLFITK
jgi:hypothetical protein